MPMMSADWLFISTAVVTTNVALVDPAATLTLAGIERTAAEIPLELGPVDFDTVAVGFSTRPCSTARHSPRTGVGAVTATPVSVGSGGRNTSSGRH